MITVSVVGYGTVGRTLSLLLLGSRYRMRLNILDPNPDKKGVFLDLKHGARMHPRKALLFNDQKALSDSDYIFFTAGKPTKHGASRLTTADVNIHIVEKVLGNIPLKRSTRIIAISNPVDLITQAVLHVTGLPKTQVVGTGTLLDSARFSFHLADLLGVDVNRVNGWVLGEHGESQVAALSMSTVDDVPIEMVSVFDERMAEMAMNSTRNAAFEIRKTEAGTSMAISQCAMLILRFFEAGTSPVIPLSVSLDTAYLEKLGLEGPMCLSVPARITRQGVELAEMPDLTEEEWSLMKTSARALAAYSDYFK